MLLSNFKKLSIDGIEMVQLFINGVLAWKSGYKNWVKYSINADGTIYNGGLGYKDGYRVRSGGAETTQATASCTGFIPVSGGDVIRISGLDFTKAGVENAINASNSSFTNIGQITSQPSKYGIFLESAYMNYDYKSIVEESTGVWKWIVPPSASGTAYIRVTAYTRPDAGGSGADMIVTVNEEISS